MSQYTIKVPHFYCMEYIEGNKKMIIEMDFREPRLFLDESLITKWEVPYQDERISDKKRKEILKNVYKFLLTKTEPENIIIQ